MMTANAQPTIQLAGKNRNAASTEHKITSTQKQQQRIHQAKLPTYAAAVERSTPQEADSWQRSNPYAATTPYMHQCPIQVDMSYSI